jgi:hypothetical protein
MEMEVIKKFLNKNYNIGFIGATQQKEKWGYKKYIELKKAGFKVFPINPKYENIDSDKCFNSLKSLIKFLDEKPDYVITIVPPKITEKVCEQCKDFGIDKIWMQPGSESDKAINFCKQNNIEVVHDVCIVVDALQNL